MEILHLTSIYEAISEQNARALEDGSAQVRISPEVNEQFNEPVLVVWVNDQPVYAPVAEAKLNTYTNCAQELERYMNSY